MQIYQAPIKVLYKDRIEIGIRDSNIIHVKRDSSGWIQRGESTLKMIIDALLRLPSGKTVNRDITIFIGDHPKEGGGLAENSFYYCISDSTQSAHVLPDFPFESWRAAGIENYRDTVADIVRKGSQPWQSDKLFWIGNQYTHANRQIFMQIASQHPQRIEAYNTKVIDAVNGRNVPYVSLPDHCRYKYLIDMEGVGYSGRIPFLLHSQRVLFIQERKWKAFFHFDLEPYKHFIPVKNDLSDLLAQLDFVESQGEAYYRQIAQNALHFAQNRLNYDAVVEVMQRKLLGLPEVAAVKPSLSVQFIRKKR